MFYCSKGWCCFYFCMRGAHDIWNAKNSTNRLGSCEKVHIVNMVRTKIMYSTSFLHAGVPEISTQLKSFHLSDSHLLRKGIYERLLISINLDNNSMSTMSIYWYIDFSLDCNWMKLISLNYAAYLIPKRYTTAEIFIQS